VQRNIDVLPTSLLEALDALKKDEVLRGTLGEHLFERYIDVKTKEWDEFKKQVTSWEIDTYLDTF
jgi:glutamine synthetase